LLLGIFLIILAVTLIGFRLFVVIFSIAYQYFIYPYLIRPRFDSSWLPRCSIIVPSKGLPKNGKKNWSSFLYMDYPDYEVIYVVEDKNDPGANRIKSLIKNHKHAKLVVAGRAKTCAQKNHNILAGIAATNNAEVYVFADNDISPSTQWLRTLILPLSSDRIYVTSGYKWFQGKNGSISEHIHTFMNMHMYTFFIFSACFINIGLWGGSMAIRSDKFDELMVSKLWSETVVDDMSLSKILKASKKRIIFVPECITHSNDLLQTLHQCQLWYTRQILFFKVYFRSLWRYTLFVIAAIIAFYLLLPIAVIGSILTENAFYNWGGKAAALFFGGEYLAVLLSALLGPNTRLGRFTLRIPFLLLFQNVIYMKTIGVDIIVWSDILYNIDREGRVTKVEHLIPK